MNNLIPHIPSYASKRISDMVAKDPSILNLSIGEPYYPPPVKLLNLLKEKITLSPDFDNISYKYADSRGSQELRSEIAKRYQRLYNAQLDPETEILVTHGASEAIWLCILTLTSLGDEVMIADPSYVMYEVAVRLLGRVPKKLPTELYKDGTLNKAIIERSIGEKTKVLVINSPENPTGAVYSKEQIRELREFAKSKNIYFVHDEVYDNFLFGQEHANMFRNQSQTDPHSVIINSFSKRYSMMGWRLGWLIGSKEFIDSATMIHTNLTLNLGSFHQDVAAKILNDPEVETEIRENAKQLRANLDYLKDILTRSGGYDFSDDLPKGAFFLFPEVSAIYERIPEEYHAYATKGEAVADYLLKEYKIAVVPGVYYGKNGRDHIRIAVTVDRKVIDEIGDRLLKSSIQIANN